MTDVTMNMQGIAKEAYSSSVLADKQETQILMKAKSGIPVGPFLDPVK